MHEALPTSVGRPGVRDIPLECIVGTIEPNRAYQFDSDFRPSPKTRDRWLRVWMAFNGGASLPPISVVRVGNSVRDPGRAPPRLGRPRDRRGLDPGERRRLVPD